MLKLLPEAVWNSVVSVANEDTDLFELRTSEIPFRELVWPTTSRLHRCCSKMYPLHNNSTYYSRQGTALTRQNFYKLTCATLKIKLFSNGHSTANVCLWRLHGCVLDFKLLSATGVAYFSIYRKVSELGLSMVEFTTGGVGPIDNQIS